MKKFLLFLVILAGTVRMSSSQVVSGTISGNIQGAPLNGITVHVLMYDSFLSFVVFQDSVSTDLMGNYISSYTFTGPPFNGVLYVWFFDCINNMVIDTVNWDAIPPGNHPVANFNYCLSSSCSAQFNSSSSGLTVNFTNTSITGLGTKYTWNFGDGTDTNTVNPVHTYATSGAYTVCLHLADTIGLCYDTYCDSISVFNGSPLVVAGTVNIASSLPDSAIIYLIAPGPDTIPAIMDSMTISTALGNAYAFPVNTGNYYVKAALLPADTEYGHYLPTYYENSLSWTNSTAIVVTTASSYNNDISLVVGQNLSGPGSIGGKVTISGTGLPYPNATIILTDEFGTGIAYTYTNAGGTYEFKDLPYGTYQVFVEIVGKSSHIRKVELSVSHKAEENANFIVQGKYIVTGQEIFDLIDWSGPYPNPAGEKVYFDFHLERNLTAEWTITAMQGREMISEPYELKTGEQRMELDVSNLPEGVYLVRFSTSQYTVVDKLIIHR